MEIYSVLCACNVFVEPVNEVADMIWVIVIVALLLIVTELFSLTKVSSQSDIAAVKQFEEWLNEKYGKINDD